MLLLPLLICHVVLAQSTTPDEIKEDEGYIIQELKFNWDPYHYVPGAFAFATAILSENNEYYFSSQEELLQAIKDEHLVLNLLTMVVDPHYLVYSISEEGEILRMKINYSNGMANVLQLDDTDILKIGCKHYVTRKLKYAYMDNVKLMYMDEDGELKPFNANRPRLFLYTKELLPIDDEVRVHVWKKKYELPEFWQKHWQMRILFQPDSSEQH